MSWQPRSASGDDKDCGNARAKRALTYSGIGVLMSRLTAKDFPQELLELYDYYAHGRITKREFLDHAGKFAIGGLTAAAILSSMRPTYALATQVEFTDPDIIAEYIT